MSAASRYWRLIRIDAAGKRKIKEIREAQVFFLESFPEFMVQSEVPDALIQRQLVYWMRQDNQKSDLAQRCLQCFVSYQIERVCLKLESQFGREHGFTCSDLLPFVLDDGRHNRSEIASGGTAYQSLSNDLLQSFDPEQSSLATWTTRRVRHHRELNAFLLEHGVYLVSDWAILNDTRPKQLQRIFMQFRLLGVVEVRQATQLLESYHAVYRTQRLLARQTGSQRQCSPPTRAQLQQIAQYLFDQTNQRTDPETLLTQLQEIASYLREYRIYVRGGAPPLESLDIVNEMGSLSDRLPASVIVDRQDADEEQREFLKIYRQQFRLCLDQALAQVTDDQAQKLSQKDAQKGQEFLIALQMFHCRGLSMSEIAPHVNRQAEYQVSRLLKLKPFRADVREQLILRLRDRVFDLAIAYSTPERLQTLARRLEDLLDEEASAVIQRAETEASTANTTSRSPSSLFARRLCHYLDTRRDLL